MADVKDGVGVYLSVFLLTVRNWNPQEIGIVIAVPGLVGILIQPLAGSLIDNTKHKRLLLISASLIIAACCLMVILSGEFYPIFISQAVLGFTQSVYAPCVAAISLGIVGQAALSPRIGRNESFNHLGNMLAAIIAGLLGRFVSYEAIFYFSIAQCLALVLAVLIIQEKDIDHDLARGAGKDEVVATGNHAGVMSLLTNKNCLYFVIAMALFHLANGAMLIKPIRRSTCRRLSSWRRGSWCLWLLFRAGLPKRAVNG
jgi:MFS family permease